MLDRYQKADSDGRRNVSAKAITLMCGADTMPILGYEGWTH